MSIFRGISMSMLLLIAALIPFASAQRLPLLPLRPVMEFAAFMPAGLHNVQQNVPQPHRVQSVQSSAASLPNLGDFKIPDNFNLTQTVKDILASLPAEPHSPGSVSRDRYIIAMRPNITSQDLDDHIKWLLDQLANTKLFSSETIGKFAGILDKFDSEFLKGYHGHFPEWLVALIQRSPLVRLVERDAYIGSTQAPTTPPVTLPQDSNVTGYTTAGGLLANLNESDTTFQSSSPWGLARISHRERTTEKIYIYSPEGGKNVDIYIVDTGVNAAHPDFGGRARQAISFSPDGNEDKNGHGTHVSGVAGSNTYGVAKAANIIGVKVLDDDGNGLISQVIKGLEWILKEVSSGDKSRRAVINMSLGGGGRSDLLNEVVGRAIGVGVPVSVAAGNNNTNACNSSPADSGLVMTVGASNPEDRRASFSNWGPCVNIYAPGTNISSTYIPASATHILQGTSMAAPHVAGLMGIILSIYPTATPQDVYKILGDIATKNVITDSKGGAGNMLFTGLNGTKFEGLGRNTWVGDKWGMVLESVKDVWI